jgi:serine/threonine-protein kinase
MEYVEGKTLADLLDHGPVKPERAIEISKQVLAGLEHAHERGILHRDLKPANVMIVEVEGYPGDFVKILDFGLAKLAWPGEDKRDVTVEGIAIGTPGYMSPEQAAGVPSDRRSDIYCAGALLYHLVTGNKIFEGDDVREVLRRHREETPASPRALKPAAGISEELEDVLYRAMQRDPGKRYQHAREMAAALRNTPEMEVRSSRDNRPPPLPGVRTPTPSGEATRADAPASRRRKGSSSSATWAVVGIVVGSVAAVAAVVYSPLGDYVHPRQGSRVTPIAPVTQTTKHVTATPHETAKPKPVIVAAPPDLAEPATVAAPPADLAVAPAATARVPDSGTTTAANDDNEDDDTPAKADDGSNENDRAPAPESASVQNHPAPSVRNISDARALMRKGDTDGALAGLYRLRHAKPAPSSSKASEIATLIGDLYFDKKWWTDGLREYRFAITVDARAKRNDLLLTNSVRALGDHNTFARARRLILDYVGRGAVPALKRAAKSGATPQLRRRAQKVLATLESKSYRSHR